MKKKRLGENPSRKAQDMSKAKNLPQPRLTAVEEMLAPQK